MKEILAVALVVAMGFWLQTMWPYFTLWRVRNHVRYSHTGFVTLPPALVGETLDEFLRLSACSFESENNGMQAYYRGCQVIFRADHTTASSMIPHMIGFGVVSESDTTRVELGYRVVPYVRMTVAAEKQFLEFARFESMRVLEILQSMACQGEAA